jgi:hypothetical protein
MIILSAGCLTRPDAYWICSFLSSGRFTQQFHVAKRRFAEEPFVIPAEVRGVFVAHPEAGLCRVEVFAEHQTASLMKPQLLLKLQGAHYGDSFEVVMEAGDAHAKFARHAVNPKRLVEVVAE